LFLIHGGKVLLLRRYRTGYRTGAGVVAGHGQQRDRDHGGVREARERSVILAPDDVRVVGVMPPLR
jgi:hypothetical protein